MSAADQNPGTDGETGVSPWGIPVSIPAAPAAGGHLPAFGAPAAEPVGSGAATGPQAAISFPQAPIDAAEQARRAAAERSAPPFASQPAGVSPFPLGSMQGGPAFPAAAQPAADPGQSYQDASNQAYQGSATSPSGFGYQQSSAPFTPSGDPAATGQPAWSQSQPAAPPFPAAPITQFPGTTEPESHFTQAPLPPSMQSPYGAPLQPSGPGLRLDPPQARRGSGGPAAFADERGAKRRKTVLVSSLAAVAVVGVGAAVALIGGGSPQKDSSLAGASHDAATSGTTGATGSATKPFGDTQAGAVQPGAPLPTGGATSGVTSAAPGAGPGPSSSGGATAGHPGPGVTGPATSALVTARPSTSGPHVPATSGKPSTTPATTRPSTTPPPTTPAGPPLPTDCTTLVRPPAQMPVISQGSPGSVAAVQELQCLLKKSELGIKPLVIDGSWGPDTQSALMAFKSCNNAPTVTTPGGTPPYARLAIDGVVDQQVWADLYFWDAQYFNGVSYYCNGTR